MTNKTVELKEEDLEKVNGGFTGNNYVKPNIKKGDRVKVRYQNEYGQTLYAFGTVVLILAQPTVGVGCARMLYTVSVQLDGKSSGTPFPAGDVELA